MLFEALVQQLYDISIQNCTIKMYEFWQFLKSFQTRFETKNFYLQNSRASNHLGSWIYHPSELDNAYVRWFWFMLMV